MERHCIDGASPGQGYNRKKETFMKLNNIYAKTALGREATGNPVKVIERNQRLVLILLDGNTTVAELGEKIGDVELVDQALGELERGGFVVLVGKGVAREEDSLPYIPKEPTLMPFSQFSFFSINLNTRQSTEGEKEIAGDSGKPEALASDKADEKPGTTDTTKRKQAPKRPRQRPKKVAADKKVEEEAVISSAEESLASLELEEFARPEDMPQRGEDESNFAFVGQRTPELVHKPIKRRKKAKASAGSAPSVVSRNYGGSSRGIFSKLLLLGLGAIVAAVLWVCFLYPYNNHRAELEAELSEKMGVKVAIGEVSGPRGFPIPSLELKNVRLGEHGEGKLHTVILPDLIGRVFGSTRVQYSAVEAEGGRIPLELFSNWSGARPSTSGVGELKFRNVNLSLGDESLAHVDGEVHRALNGGLESVKLTSTKKNLQIELKPMAEHLLLSITGKNWSPHPDFPLSFDLVSAKGTLSRGEIVLDTLDISLLGGQYEGNWSVRLRNHLIEMKGKGDFQRIDAKKLTSTWMPRLDISGLLSGNLEFQAHGHDANELRVNLAGTGNFQVERGELRILNLGETVRRPDGHAIEGGSTKFDLLRAALHLGSKGLQISNLQLSAGLLQVQGNIKMDLDREFQGLLGVSINQGTPSGSNISAKVKVGGKLPRLILTPTRSGLSGPDGV